MGESFRNRSWNQRFQGMGDEAEAQFEQWAKENERGFARYGLNRPPLQVHRLPHLIRYTPDYLMTHYLVEVQGFGRDQRFKLKTEKLNALREWAYYHPVRLFAWDSTNQRRIFITLDEIEWLLEHRDVPMGSFPEGKDYYEFHVDLLLEVGQVV